MKGRRDVQVLKFQYFKPQPRLIDYVAKGEQDSAEKILKVTDEKLRVSVLSKAHAVTDLSGRVFDPILPLHYALWALDWHMWKMLLTYLPKEAVIKQLKEFEEKGVTYRKSVGDQKEAKVTEKQFDFSPLISTLSDYAKEYMKVLQKDEKDPQRNSDLEKLKKTWCKSVGGEQKNIPVHIAQEYCHPLQNFASQYPNPPAFDEATLSRKAEFRDPSRKMIYWFSPGSGLGSQFAMCRGAGMVCGGVDGISVCCIDIECDAKALKALRDVRMQQFDNLKKDYLEPVVIPSVSVAP